MGTEHGTGHHAAGHAHAEHAGEHAADHTAEHAADAEAFWEDRYRGSDQVWSGRANAVLVEVVEPRTPGTALDLGCGEGGDALWLAGRGWRVTAVDVSRTALDRTAAHAAEAGLGDLISVEQHDLASTFPAGRFDLVSAQFLQSPIEFPRERVLQQAADAVAPGGLLLIVEHAAGPPGAPPEFSHAHFPQPEETFATLELPPEQWRTERIATEQRHGTGPDGKPFTWIDGVIALVRQRP
jgi:SAM-dependent methyltransferase